MTARVHVHGPGSRVHGLRGLSLAELSSRTRVRPEALLDLLAEDQARGLVERVDGDRWALTVNGSRLLAGYEAVEGVR